MIRSITVINAYGEALEIELTRPDKSGIGVQSITGVGAPPMNILTTNSYYDGTTVGHIRADQRNIVFTFFPMAYPSVETSRQMIYRYFPTHSLVTMVFYLDNRTVSIEGYVESNEPNIFENPETISVSVVCPRPFFETYVPYLYNFYESVPLFEFPFENDSLTEPLLEFGDISPNNSINIDYRGEVPTGVILTMRFSRARIGNIAIYNQETGERMVIDEAMALSLLRTQGWNTTGLGVDDARLELDTNVGKQRLEFISEGDVRRLNIMASLGLDIDWLTLQPGKQELIFTTTQNTDKLLMSIQYREKFIGL